MNPDQLTAAILDRLSFLALDQLAHLGRPATAQDKPDARFIKFDKGEYHYVVYAKRFNPAQFQHVQDLQMLRAKAKQDGDEARSLAITKELAQLLERSMVLKHKAVATNAVARITLAIKRGDVTGEGVMAEAPTVEQHIDQNIEEAVGAPAGVAENVIDISAGRA